MLSCALQGTLQCNLIYFLTFISELTQVIKFIVLAISYLFSYTVSLFTQELRKINTMRRLFLSAHIYFMPDIIDYT
jgi:hypothetical protein